MKVFVRRDALLSEETVFHERMRLAELVEVVTAREGPCRHYRIEEVLPDVARSLAGINLAVVHMSEEVSALSDLVVQERRVIERLQAQLAEAKEAVQMLKKKRRGR
jgi:uncharacterized coiled-coil protein SlyX